MVSSWNRIADYDIIFQHRFNEIVEDGNKRIDYYKRVGGEFVHSTLSLDA